jgi:2',3'-cyclic-nucleotide 2'-phosphodiesterase (5'-nucleotidase family)
MKQNYRLSAPAAMVLLLVLPACVKPAPADRSSPRMNVAHRVVQDDVDPDSALEALIAPFREELDERTSEVIGTATGPFVKGDPEGTLDNLVAEAMLWSARATYDAPVVMAMGNDGGLRAPINEGPISLAEVFELMPFENRIAVLEFSGHQVDSLAQQIARTNGEPVAGIRMSIVGMPPMAVDVRIGGAPVDPAGRYRIAVSDYLANGGGYWPQLWTPLARTDLDVLIRDAIEQYIRDRGSVSPRLDGRVRIGTGL